MQDGSVELAGDGTTAALGVARTARASVTQQRMSGRVMWTSSGDPARPTRQEESNWSDERRV
jgi:hypothetical protein